MKKKQPKQICIIGMGYVGLTLAIHAAEKNFTVHGVEISDKIYKNISNGVSHFFEPELDIILRRHINRNFFIYKRIPSKIKFDAIIISVGTPVSFNDSNRPTLTHLDNSVETILPHISEKTLLVLRSTVPVGTTRKIAKKLRKYFNGKTTDISFCPERTAEGQALEELEKLPQVVSGNTPSALKKAVDLFSPLSDEVLSCTSLEEAELIKLFNNTFRDSLFSISNTFNHIAQSFGLDGKNVIDIANHNYPRSFIPKPGFVAGPCLEKDAYILATNIKDEPSKTSLLSARINNENLEVKFANKLKEIISSNNINNILMTGMAFKGNPPTNDTRGSSSINILNHLKIVSNKIVIHDFMNTKRELKEISICNSVETTELLRNDTLVNYELVVILNNHPSYKSTAFKKFIDRQVAKQSIIIDVWDVLSLESKLTLTNIFSEVRF